MVKTAKKKATQSKKTKVLKISRKKSVLPVKSDTKATQPSAVKQKKKMPNGKRFLPGQSGNPKGRPRKLVSTVIAELKREGLEAVSASQVADTYKVLLNVTMNDLRKLTLNETVPSFIRIVAKAMLSGKGVEMIDKMLDRSYGKTLQRIDTHQVVVLPDLTPALIKKLNDEFERDN